MKQFQYLNIFKEEGKEEDGGRKGKGEEREAGWQEGMKAGSRKSGK